MNFDIGLGALLHQKSNSSCLIAGKILIDNASACQNQGKFLVRRFLWRLEFDRMKLRSAIWMIEALFKQTWCTRMIFRWAGPKYAILLLDLLPRDAVVISVAAVRSDAHLIKDREWVIKLKVLFSAHASRNFLNDPPIGARFPGRVGSLVDFDDAAFAIGGHALVFTPGAAGKNYIRVARSFGHEKIDTHIKVEPFQRTPHFVSIRQTHHHVVTN